VDKVWFAACDTYNICTEKLDCVVCSGYDINVAMFVFDRV